MIVATSDRPTSWPNNMMTTHMDISGKMIAPKPRTRKLCRSSSRRSIGGRSNRDSSPPNAHVRVLASRVGRKGIGRVHREVGAGKHSARVRHLGEALKEWNQVK